MLWRLWVFVWGSQQKNGIIVDTFWGRQRKTEAFPDAEATPLCSFCVASTAFTLMLAENFTFITKVNLPWNWLCPAETQQGVQTQQRLREQRWLPRREESQDERFRWHRWALPLPSDGWALQMLFENKMLPQHNCCFSSAAEQENKAVMHKLQWSQLWDLCVFAANNKTLFFVQMPHQLLILSKGWVHGTWKWWTIF